MIIFGPGKNGKRWSQGTLSPHGIKLGFWAKFWLDGRISGWNFSGRIYRQTEKFLAWDQLDTAGEKIKFLKIKFLKMAAF